MHLQLLNSEAAQLISTGKIKGTVTSEQQTQTAWNSLMIKSNAYKCHSRTKNFQLFVRMLLIITDIIQRN